MLSRVNGVGWMEDKEDEDSATWTRNNVNTNTNTNTANNNNNNSVVMENQVEEMTSLSGFKSMLEVEDDWYVSGNTSLHNHQDITFSPPNLGDPATDNLLLNAVDSSSSCSPTSSVFNNLDASQMHYFMPPKNNLSTFLNVVSNNPLDHGFDLGEMGFLETQASHGLNRGGGGILGSFNDFSSNNQMTAPNLCSEPQFGATRVLQLPDNTNSFLGFRGYDENSGNSLFLSRSKLLRPLENLPPLGAPPTLFQKRAALRKNLADNGTNLGVLGAQSSQILSGLDSDKGKKEMSEDNERKRKFSFSDDVDDVSINGSGLNYDSDEFIENNRGEEIGKNGGSSSNANSTVTGGGDQKGKKKGLPAKNLMAERRRRKKLNDRLYMLRSVVPKISKVRITSSFSREFIFKHTNCRFFFVSFSILISREETYEWILYCKFLEISCLFSCLYFFIFWPSSIFCFPCSKMLE